MSGIEVDNHELVAEFCPGGKHYPFSEGIADGHGASFIYTEMLDRGKRKGNNGHRLLKTFFHRSKEEFLEQWPTIKQLCDMANVRACTRVAPRTFKKVGREFTRLVVETALTENWDGMKTLYNRALGIVSPEKKLWLWDVDEISLRQNELGVLLGDSGRLVSALPSRKGWHYITVPCGPLEVARIVKDAGFVPSDVQIHKDNPTNLYIPADAD